MFGAGGEQHASLKLKLVRVSKKGADAEVAVSVLEEQASESRANAEKAAEEHGENVHRPGNSCGESYSRRSYTAVILFPKVPPTTTRVWAKQRLGGMTQVYTVLRVRV